MPSFVFHVGASASCSHGGQISTVPTSSKVLVSGQPVATLADQYPIAGCPFQIPYGVGTKPQPCVEVKWTVPAARVTVNGQPLLLQSSTGLCLSAERIPQGAPVVSSVQTRVQAT